MDDTTYGKDVDGNLTITVKTPKVQTIPPEDIAQQVAKADLDYFNNITVPQRQSELQSNLDAALALYAAATNAKVEVMLDPDIAASLSGYEG